MIHHVISYVFPAAFGMLPGVMNSREARAMLLAIGLQESGFEARRQKGNGPARGFWQFEAGGGVKGVLGSQYLAPVLLELKVDSTVPACHVAIEYNDTLACVFARLLLWSLPGMLPPADDPSKGWQMYQEAWRPGKPRPSEWNHNFATAWSLIE